MLRVPKSYGVRVRGSQSNKAEQHQWDHSIPAGIIIVFFPESRWRLRSPIPCVLERFKTSRNSGKFIRTPPIQEASRFFILFTSIWNKLIVKTAKKIKIRPAFLCPRACMHSWVHRKSARRRRLHSCINSGRDGASNAVPPNNRVGRTKQVFGRINTQNGQTLGSLFFNLCFLSSLFSAFKSKL